MPTADDASNDSLSIEEWWKRCHTGSSEYTWFISDTSAIGIINGLQIHDKFPPSSRILEIGVGTGNLCKYLVQNECIVDSLDICEEALSKIRGIARNTFLAHGKYVLPDSEYDLVVSHLVSQHMNDIDLSYQIKQVLRALKPNGTMAMQFAYAVDGSSDQSLNACKTGGVCRSLEHMSKLVQQSGGKISWSYKSQELTAWGTGWFNIHIKRA